MRKIIFIFLVFLNNFCYADEDGLKIGAALALTGPAASFCVPVQNGMILAAEELAKENAFPINITYEDDHCDPKTTVSAVQKLITVNKVKAIVTCASNTSKAVSPITEKQKIPHIAVATDPEVVAGKNYVLNLWVTPESEMIPLLEEVKRRKYQNIARVTTQHAGPLSFKSMFDKFNNDGSIKIILDEEFTEQNNDFKSVILKIKAHPNIDAVFINLFAGKIGLFARQAREMGVTLPFFGLEFFENKEEVSAANGAMEGAWYIQADEGTNDFIERYRKRFPGASTFAAANGYDAVQLFALALKAGSAKPEMVSKYLHDIKNYQGALGLYSASGDNRFNLPAIVKIIKAGQFQKFFP